MSRCEHGYRNDNQQALPVEWVELEQRLGEAGEDGDEEDEDQGVAEENEQGEERTRARDSGAKRIDQEVAQVDLVESEKGIKAECGGITRLHGLYERKLLSLHEE